MKELISNLQIENAKRNIILEILQEGVSPSSFQVLEKLNYFFQDKKVGLPYYKPLEIEANSITNSEDWNKALNEIKVDLDLLFQSNGELNKKIIENEESFNTEKNLLESYLEKTEMKINTLQDMLNKANYIQSKYENFENLVKIDLSSDCFIDLKQKKATLNKISGSKRYSISDAAVTVTSNTKNINEEQFGETSQILNDLYNQFCIYKYSQEQNNPCQISINVVLKKPLDINTISIDINASNSVKAELYVSEDNISFKKLYDVQGINVLEWNFDNLKINSFNIILTKGEADSFNNDLYEHHFIIRNISTYKNLYENENTLVTKTMKFFDAVDEISLKAEDMIHNNTNLIYYLGIEDVNKNTIWHSIDNYGSVSLNILTDREKIVNRAEGGFGTMIGNGCYRVCKLPSKTNTNTIELFTGYQMWYREKLENFGGLDYTVNLNDYNPSKVTLRDFIDTENYNLKIRTREMHLLTQYVYCDEEKIVSFDKTQVPVIISNQFQQLVICNNVEVLSSNGVFTLNLKPGKNKIQMVLYLMPKTQDDYYEYDTYIRTNFKDVTDDIYAYPKMTQLSYKELSSSSLASNYDYFAIKDEWIVVKHLPNEVKPNYENELRYFVKYKYLNDKSKYLHYDIDKPYIKIKLKALLLSGNKNITPQIINYTLSSK